LEEASCPRRLTRHARQFPIFSFYFPISIFQFPPFVKVAAKDDNQFVVDCERQVLEALWRGALESVAAEAALRSYRWREPVHQVIFDFLISMPGANPELWREQLPTHLTRRGFPDFDLTWFQSTALAETDVERLIQRLRLTATRFEDK